METRKQTARRRWPSYAILAGGALTALVAVGAQGRGAPPRRGGGLGGGVTVAGGRPRVEVVFALDTTGSMSGLIDGAKRKIWSVASFIARGQPAPDLRVGLVAYRDVGDAYVTRVHDLDGDLDRVYQRLLEFRADGGGDTPEHVARALHESVHSMSWSGGQQTLRMIYLVGDAPAHTDYQDGFDFEKAAKAAAGKGIQVHAIRCGQDGSTELQFRRVASLGRGQFLTIGQDGGMRDEKTPYDEELARLHDKLSGTVMAYGSGRREAEAAVASAAAAPTPTKASRATFMAAQEKAVGGSGDLVSGVAGGLRLDGIARDDLPVDLQALAPEQRKAKVEEKAKERKEVQGRIQALASERDAFIKKQEGGKGNGFDAQVERTISEGAGKIGVKY